MIIYRVGSIEQLVNDEHITNNSVVIVGAGKDGKSICDKFLENNTNVRLFVDENVSRQCEKYQGVDCVKPENVLLSDNDVLVIGIGDFAFLDDESVLNKPIIGNIRGDKKCILMLDRVICLTDKIMSHFKESNIDISGNYFTVGGVVFPNYFKMEEMVRRSFVVESGDLFLPYFFDDYSMVDEGPYHQFDDREDGTNVVIDCGANVGVFSAAEAAKGHKVYAFEPVMKTRTILEKVANKYSNIVIENYALSDKSGKVTMMASDNLGQNKIVEEKNVTECVESVPCITLDEFVEKNGIKRVDYIKADIEGAERYMLKGAKKVLERFAPRLSICTYHLDDDPIVLERIIKEENPNYTVVHEYKKLYAYVD